MEHIDEGTIHTWLDGASTPEEGARIESHIAGCAACAAAVAEARGLIAASSRILSALDDVPGGVIPKAVPDVQVQAGSAGVAGDAHARHSRRTRPWYTRPQFAAAAAIAFIAVTTTVLVQRGGTPGIGDLSRESASLDETAPAVASAPPAPAATQPAAAPASGAFAESTSSMQRAARATPPSRPADMASSVADRPSTLASAEAKRSPAAEPRPRVASERREFAKTDAASLAEADRATALTRAKAVAPVQARQALSPDANRVDSAVKEVAARGSALNVASRTASKDVASAPPPSAAPTAASGGAASGAVARTTDSSDKVTPVLNADAITRLEKARVAGEQTVQMQAVVTTGSSGSVSRRDRNALSAPAAPAPPASATPATLAGCYRLQASPLTRQAGLGDLLRLDFAAAGSDDARPAYVARDLSVVNAVGNVAAGSGAAALRWTISTGGQVILVVGDGDQARRIPLAMLASPGASVPAGQVQASRVRCEAP